MSGQQQHTPPKWALKLLSWFCPPSMLEGILGDLMEDFSNDIAKVTVNKAKRRFVYNVIRLFHPSILFRNKWTPHIFRTELFKSHLTVAWRNMFKYRFYTFINVLGLSLAIGMVFLIYLFIATELSFDEFHANKERIYRVTQYTESSDGVRSSDSKTAIISIPLVPALTQKVPGISRFSRFGSSSVTVSADNTSYGEVVTYVDSLFLEIFDFPVVIGDKKTMLDHPNDIALTPEMASKYFGASDPIGKSLDIEINDSIKTFVVSGVVNNMKGRSSIPFSLLIPFQRMEMSTPKSVLEDFDVAFIEGYIEFIHPVDAGISEILTSSLEIPQQTDGSSVITDVQPLLSIHLDHRTPGLASTTNAQKLWIMAALAALVLIIATINFITLSTGHAMNRVKEIGLRKAMGAFKSSLSIQLIFEALVVTTISGVIGTVLAYLAIPEFNKLVDGSVQLRVEALDPWFLLMVLLLISVISGGLQSLILVRFRPIEALRGRQIFSTKESWLNQGLVIVQFSMSVLLVIGTLVMRTQMNYIQSKDLGFDKERLVEINTFNSNDRESSYRLVERFKSETSSHAQILAIGASMNNFREPWTQLVFKQLDETNQSIYFNQVDTDFINTMQLELVAGRGFTPGTKRAKSIIVNQALVNHFKWDDPLSMQIPGKNFNQEHQIIGVVKDFHFSTLHEEIQPLILALEESSIASGITGMITYMWPPNLNQLLVRIGPGDLSAAMDILQQSWKQVNPGKPFTFNFVDDILQKNYAEEARWSKVINAASIFAMVIAWMGLIGLARLSVQKRVKEIGIRKVLGSSVFSVTSLLSRRFLTLVMISNVIAWPLAFEFLNRWLESFSYRVSLEWVVFLAVGLGVLVVAILSVGIQSYLAAQVNPVESLKFE